jgi:hypothetical protein
MQVSRSDKLEGGRGFHSIGRIKASSEWRGSEADCSSRLRIHACDRALSTAQRSGSAPRPRHSIVGLLPEARAQYLIPTLTTYQTNWTEIGKRLADAVTSEIVAAAADREPEEGTAPKLLHARVQYKMPVEFSPGESVHRVEASG